jgi:hypothetical protein
MFLFSVIDLSPFNFIIVVESLHRHLMILLFVCLFEDLLLFLLLDLHLQLLFEFIMLPMSILAFLLFEHLFEVFPLLLLLPYLPVNLKLLLNGLILNGDISGAVNKHLDPLFPFILLGLSLVFVSVQLLLIIAKCIDVLLLEGLFEEHLAMED